MFYDTLYLMISLISTKLCDACGFNYLKGAYFYVDLLFIIIKKQNKI